MNAELIAANLTAHWIQVGLLSASTLAALRVLRVKEPRLTLIVLQGVLFVTLLLPWVQPWRLIEAAASVSASGAIAATTTEVVSISAVQATAPSRIDAAGVLLIAIACGIVARLLWIAFGLFYVRRLLLTARPIDAPAIAQQLEPQVGVSARYVEHSRPSGPSTFGIFQPTIALPAGFPDLTPAFQRAVVCHELLHVKRRDTLVSLLEEVVYALFWFHPLLWAVRHQIRAAREQAVDATVLDVVGDRSEYVRCLVEMSGHDLMPHLSRAGAAMIRTRELKARVNAIFQEVRMSRIRLVTVSTALVALVGFATWSAAMYAPLQAMAPPSELTRSLAAPVEPAKVNIPRQVVAAAQSTPATQAPRKQINASYAEYPAEALEKRISGTVRVNITINPLGEVSTADVVAGPAELRASAFKAAMGLKYTPAASTTSATIYVEYRIDNQSWGARIHDGAGTTIFVQRPRAEGQNPSTSPQDTGVQPLRVGGNIRPPRKIKDVPPDYPASARNAKVQGVVILETTVGADGRVEDVRPLRSIPLLDQAAIDAVKQWQYEPTLLNGQPISVIMTVTVNFSLRGPATLVVLKITLPNGQTPVLTVRDGDIGYLDIPDLGRFGIAPSIGDPASPSSSTRVSIYERADSGPRLLGTVDVALGAGTVQSATTPSFGIELVGRVDPPQQ